LKEHFATLRFHSTGLNKKRTEHGIMKHFQFLVKASFATNLLINAANPATHYFHNFPM